MIAAGKSPRVYHLPKDWQVPGQPSMDRRVESARRLLARDDRPTAVIAYELAEAMVVVRAAYLLGLWIPEDHSLIQFHHWVDDRFFIPIHTVSNSMEQVGREAVDMLLEKIERPGVPLPACVVPVTLLDGATCLPLHR